MSVGLFIQSDYCLCVAFRVFSFLQRVYRKDFGKGFTVAYVFSVRVVLHHY